MAMADTLRLLITITVCCCITGLLMWLFLLYNKKASIHVLLLCSVLLIVRFLYPYEFPFTHSFYITKGYPELNDFFSKTFSIGQIDFSVAMILLGIWVIGSLWNGLQFYSITWYCKKRSPNFPTVRMRSFFHSLTGSYKKGVMPDPTSL